MTPKALYIADTQALTVVVDEALRCEAVAVDTESDSFYHYREKICLVQLSYRAPQGQKDVLIDPLSPKLDMKAFAPLLADTKVEKVFHDVGYDLLLLKKHHGVAPNPVFDTMLALRILGIKAFGLGAVLKERFNLDLDKNLQKSDWSLRPLSNEQREYAANDTRHLLPLREILTAELKERERFTWFVEDCARLLDKEPPEPKPEDERFWGQKGMKKLKGEMLASARALFALREEFASAWDRPPFRVFSNETLVLLAKTRPQEMRALKAVRGLGPKVLAAFGARLLAACVSPPPFAEFTRVQRSQEEIKQAQAAEERFFRLREKRKVVSAKLGLDPEIVVSNAALWDIALGTKVEEHPDFAGWRAREVATKFSE